MNCEQCLAPDLVSSAGEGHVSRDYRPKSVVVLGEGEHVVGLVLEM